MHLSFHGAARTVTGSKHLIHLDNGEKILLDCGLFQSMGRKTAELNEAWGFDPPSVTTVVLSHAHIDHIGLLPKLVRDGFSGPIFSTPATADLARILLLDSARIQKAESRGGRARTREALYGEEDVEQCLALFQTVDYGTPHDILKGITLLYTEAGHILGSAAVHLTIKTAAGTVRLAFSGDIGRYNDPLLRAPEPFPDADIVILESTYGDSLHGMPVSIADELLKHVRHTCEEKGGKLIIPAFAVGRTQEIVYQFNRLSLEKRLPDVPFFVDSPLAVEATATIKEHTELLNDAAQRLVEIDSDGVFDFEGLTYVDSQKDSVALDKDDMGPCVIISASGMAESGRIKNHIAHALEDDRNTILLVGHCEPSSLGGQLKAGADDVAIFGDHFEVKADVSALQSMSAHGDYEDLLRWLSCQEPERMQRVVLVHGEYAVQTAFRERILRKGYAEVVIPDQHEVLEISEFGSRISD